MSFELIHKPTFTNQLLAIPKERVVQILEKTRILTDDPSPHGSQKKNSTAIPATSTGSAPVTTACSTPTATAG